MVSVPMLLLGAIVGASALTDAEANLAMANRLGWTRVGPAPAHLNLTLRVALAHSPETRAEILRTLNDVSDPDSRHYGRYLTREELRAVAAPLPGAEETVLSWLRQEAGLVGRVAGSGDVVVVSAPSAVLERLLGVELSSFQYPGMSRSIVRTVEEVRVAPSIRNFVDFLDGGAHVL